MKRISRTDTRKALAKGQVWKTPAANIEIVALGKTMIQYRITNELARQVSSQLSGIEAMENYLHTHAAELVQAPFAN
jgi:hypothetical protein